MSEEVKELTGTKMLVWDTEETHAHQQEVYGKVSTDDYPFKTLAGCKSYKHAKPLPKPWEVAPDGYRLVTDEERKRHDEPSEIMYYNKGGFDDKKWGVSIGGLICDYWRRGLHLAIAVPEDYYFEPAVIEVTMADLEEKYGKRVKIVKEKD